MKVIWSKESLDNWLEIENYISQDSPEMAIEFTDYLNEKTKYLKDNPKIGRVVRELSKSNYRELIIKNYRLVYRVEAEEISIVTVFESHRLFPLDHEFYYFRKIGDIL